MGGKGDRPSLEKYASELGLNMGRFKAALDGDKFKKDIQADSEQGAKIGSISPKFSVSLPRRRGSAPSVAPKGF